MKYFFRGTTFGFLRHSTDKKLVTLNRTANLIGIKIIAYCLLGNGLRQSLRSLRSRVLSTQMIVLWFGGGSLLNQLQRMRWVFHLRAPFPSKQKQLFLDVSTLLRRLVGLALLHWLFF